MKRVGEFRKLLGVTANVTLKELKTIYRNEMKATHPDKFVDDAEGLKQAEAKSQSVIEAYHFLTSIHPETHEANKEEYMDTISNYGMSDYYFKRRVLYVQYENGMNYEYLGVDESVFVKMINSDSPSRFAKRHIYGKYLFRKVSNGTEA